MIKLDYRYVTGWSLETDLELIARTIPLVRGYPRLKESDRATPRSLATTTIERLAMSVAVITGSAGLVGSEARSTSGR